VKGILVNIFAACRCVDDCRGNRRASKPSLHVPLVVRLEGTEVEEGKKIFAKAASN